MTLEQVRDLPDGALVLHRGREARIRDRRDKGSLITLQLAYTSPPTLGHTWVRHDEIDRA